MQQGNAAPGPLPALRRDLAAWGVFTVALAVYANALRDGFTLDDGAAVLTNGAVRGRFSPWAIATHDYWGAPRGEPGGGLYRPIPSLTYALDWTLSGGHPWLFHLTNALVHAVASVLFLSVLCARVSDRRAAVLAAVLFAVHPLHTEAVASIVGRADVLAFVFSVTAWWLHRRMSPGAAVATAAAVFAGLLCKESVVLLVPLLVLQDILGGRTRWLHGATRYGFIVLGCGLYLALRVWITGTLQGFQINPGVNALAGAPWLTREISALRLFGRFMGLLIAPLGLMPIYGASVVRASGVLDRHVLLGGVSVVGLTGLGLWTRRTKPWVTEAVAWCLLPGLFVCNAFKTYSAAFGERLLYLPSAGAMVLAGEGLAWIFRRSVRGAWALAMAFVLVFVPMTVDRNTEWKSDEELFTQAIETEPGCAGCHYVLGIHGLETRQYGDAVTDCGTAARLAPDWGSARGCYAASLAATGRTQDAARAYRAMELLPSVNVEWRLRHMVFLVEHNERGEALGVLRRLDETRMTRQRRGVIDARARALGLR